MNTNFYNAMKLVADSYDPKEIEKIPKAIFVFSDMQFDQADSSDKLTTQNLIEKYF